MGFLTERTLIVLIPFMVLFLPTGCDRKQKRVKQLEQQLPIYDVHLSSVLPSDAQITTFLYKGLTKEFSYNSIVQNGPLSVTVATCSSPVQWNVRYVNDNNISGLTWSDSFEKDYYTTDMDTEHISGYKGEYTLRFTSITNDTFAHIYVSTEKGGPQALESGKLQKLSVNRHKKKSLAVRWIQSLVDPQSTTYCLVVSTKKFYKSLCLAQTERYGIMYPQESYKIFTAQHQLTSVINAENLKAISDAPLIFCTGAKTHKLLEGLQNKQKYFLSLFGTDGQSKLRYPRGLKEVIFNTTVRPNSLKDGKISIVNIKKSYGGAIFKYKVNSKNDGILEIVVKPCGGAIDVEVSSKGVLVESTRSIKSLQKIFIQNVLKGDRYRIKIVPSKKEENGKVLKVQIYATTRPSRRNVLPLLPDTTVKEYKELRHCDSVTIGWLPSLPPNPANYCVIAKELTMKGLEDYSVPNKCALGKRLKKSADFHSEQCFESGNDNGRVITHRISHLEADHNYLIQVTLRKPRSMTLSYDWLHVHTKPKCKT